MSSQVTTAQKKEFARNLEILSQQRPSRLMGTVTLDTAMGEEKFYDQISSVELQEIVTRHADILQSDTPHARRRVTPRWYGRADFVDNRDQLTTMLQLTGPYLTNFTFAANRRRDQTIIDDFYGTAFTGKAGATSVTFPAGNEVVVGFGGGGDVGLTLDKLEEVQRLIRAQEAWEPGNMFCVLTSAQVRDLRAISVYQSIDTANNKVLTGGDMPPFAGWNFIQSELLPLSSGDRRCPAFNRRGMLAATWGAMSLNTDRRVDKWDTTQVAVMLGIGATRTDENLCFSILCNE